MGDVNTWSVDRPLTEDEKNRLIQLIDIEADKGGLPCTACHYCTSHCPQGLPIPELIALYNEHLSTQGRMSFMAPMGVGAMSEDKCPGSCIGYRSCGRVCPQQIKISEAMSIFSEILGM